MITLTWINDNSTLKIFSLISGEISAAQLKALALGLDYRTHATIGEQYVSDDETPAGIVAEIHFDDTQELDTVLEDERFDDQIEDATELGRYILYQAMIALRTFGFAHEVRIVETLEDAL